MHFVMCSRTFLFVLAIYSDIATTICHFNPFMDSVYFSIDWVGHESSTPNDVCIDSR